MFVVLVPPKSPGSVRVPVGFAVASQLPTKEPSIGAPMPASKISELVGFTRNSYSPARATEQAAAATTVASERGPMDRPF